MLMKSEWCIFWRTNIVSSTWWEFGADAVSSMLYYSASTPRFARDAKAQRAERGTDVPSVTVPSLAFLSCLLDK